MPVTKCRVCGHGFFQEPLLQYEQMPGAAQYLPDAASLKNEQGVDLKVYQCSGCGLVQLANEPVPYYKEVIRACGFSPDLKKFRSKQFSKFVKQFTLKGKKVIEIGCGRGEYLSLMRQAGVAAYGIEEAAEAVAYCQQSGLSVSQGFIETEQSKLAKAPFAAFFMMSFLEHLPNPGQTLLGVSNNLVDGAVGLVEVPNFDMVLRQKLFSEFIPDHLLYFTRETLATTLALNGFEILECAEIWHDYIISALVKKKPRLDLAAFAKRQAQLKAALERFINRFQKREVAIWGAGHQALAVMSLAGLAGKIKYVVDSATFKQGKFTPATHLPIVAPAILKSEPVKAIIVMAASYSDEVVQTIQRQFGWAIKIAVLRESNLEVI